MGKMKLSAMIFLGLSMVFPMQVPLQIQMHRHLADPNALQSPLLRWESYNYNIHCSYAGRSRRNCHSFGNMKTLITLPKKGAKLGNSCKERSLQTLAMFNALKSPSKLPFFSQFDSCLSPSFLHTLARWLSGLLGMGPAGCKNKEI